MTPSIEPIFWIAFLALIGLLLFLDLFVFHGEAHTPRIREAAIVSAFWIAMGVGFGVFVVLWLGPTKGIEYFASYLKEASLSLDNIFVFALIFGTFAVPPKYEHRVLFWGVAASLLVRLVIILAGAALVEANRWILYPFGAFLLLTGIWIALGRGQRERSPGLSPVVRLAQRRLPFGDAYDGQRFFTSSNARWVATPLLLALVVVEFGDLAFAVDSLPAVFGVTTDPFIIYTSNAFAILGLRALYFLLAGFKTRFRYLRQALSIVLVLIGLKLLAGAWISLPPWVSLVGVAVVLVGAVAFSLARTGREQSAADAATKAAARSQP